MRLPIVDEVIDRTEVEIALIDDAFANVIEELSSSVLISTFAVASGKDMAGGDYKRIAKSNFAAATWHAKATTFAAHLHMSESSVHVG